MDITIKLLGGTSEIALRHVPAGTPVQRRSRASPTRRKASLYLLAVMLVAVAVLILRTKLLPRRL